MEDLAMRLMLMIGAVLCWGVMDVAVAGGCCGGCKKTAAKKVEAATCTKDVCAKKGKDCTKCTAKKATKAVCAKGCECDVKAKAAKHISTDDLKALVKSDAKVVVVDARAAKGFVQGHIPGAKSLPAGSDAETIAKVLGDDKSVKVVTYCSSTKCGASPKLAAALAKKGYTNVVEYKVGIKGWKEAGNELGTK